MSGYAPASLLWLAMAMEDLIPSAVTSGIVAGPNSGDSYHQAAKDLPSSSYTRADYEADRVNIDVNASCALDMSMSTADMTLITGRVYRSWKDQNDPRLNDIREVIGTLNGTSVIYMDCQSGEQGSADSSHLWHLHSGGLRRTIVTMATVRALFSVIKGETYAQYLASQGGEPPAPAPTPTPGGNPVPTQYDAIKDVVLMNGPPGGTRLGDVWGRTLGNAEAAKTAAQNAVNGVNQLLARPNVVSIELRPEDVIAIGEQVAARLGEQVADIVAAELARLRLDVALEPRA